MTPIDLVFDGGVAILNLVAPLESSPAQCQSGIIQISFTLEQPSVAFVMELNRSFDGVTYETDDFDDVTDDGFKLPALTAGTHTLMIDTRHYPYESGSLAWSLDEGLTPYVKVIVRVPTYSEMTGLTGKFYRRHPGGHWV